MAVRKYFESIKKIKFYFDVRNVSYNEEDNAWIVECEVKDLFTEEVISYQVGVSDEDGGILYVEEIEDYNKTNYH